MNRPDPHLVGNQLGACFLRWANSSPAERYWDSPYLFGLQIPQLRPKQNHRATFFCLSMCSPIFNLTGLFLQPKQICTSFLSQKKKICTSFRLEGWSDDHNLLVSSAHPFRVFFFPSSKVLPLCIHESRSITLIDCNIVNQ